MLVNTAHADAEVQLRRYLGGYSPATLDRVRWLIADNRLGEHLAQQYPRRHAVQSDAALYDYVMQIKQRHLRSSTPLHKVLWQNKMDVLHKVLGLHTAISRVQGGG